MSASIATVVGVLLAVAAAGVAAVDHPDPPAAPRVVATEAADSRAARRACDRVASPAGEAHRPGTVRGARALVRRLRPGETGCLRRGVYYEDVTIGTDRIRLRSFPGERATVVGRLWIRDGADGVTITRLSLDGRNDRRLPSPTVNGDRATFSRVDVTNRHTAVCFIVGSSRYGRAEGTTIRFSRIHHCGRLPATNLEHGIYVANADRTRIAGNVIHDNADRGIQLYPDAQGTRIVGNVIDRNGQGIIFSGAGDTTSRDNRAVYNVISNARVRGNVESYYPAGARTGTGNVVTRNCIWGGRARLRIEPGMRGFSAFGNVYADPRFADPASGDYRVHGESPCAPLLRMGLQAARRR